jgi:hypothetical protein
MNMDMAQHGSVGGCGNGVVSSIDGRLQMDDTAGYATKLLRVTAYMFDKAAVWPGKFQAWEVLSLPRSSLTKPLVTRLITSCLETHANHMRARAEKSVMALD